MVRLNRGEQASRRLILRASDMQDLANYWATICLTPNKPTE